MLPAIEIFHHSSIDFEKIFSKSIIQLCINFFVFFLNSFIIFIGLYPMKPNNQMADCDISKSLIFVLINIIALKLIID